MSSTVEFDTILNRVSAELPAGSLPTCEPRGSTFNYPAWALHPPISSKSSYVPYSQKAWVNNPTKDRRFKDAKKNGVIVVSPYSIGKDTEEYSLIQRPRRSVHLPMWYTTWNGACCAKTGGRKERSWTEQFAFSRTGPNSFPVVSSLDDSLINSEIQDAVDSTQNAAYAASLSTYDLLTELAELKETFKYAGSKLSEVGDLLSKLAGQDQTTYHRGKGLTAKQLIRSSDKALRRLGSRWMEYRYAIMPLVYSFKDIQSVLDESSNRYKTERDRVIIRLDDIFPRLSGTHPTYFTLFETGEVQVRSWVKTRYDSGSMLRIVDNVAFNPFKTAWELIPMSFVVDWFLNVGDTITSQTSVDLSTQKVGTTSIRVKAQTLCHFVDNSVDTGTETRNLGPCGTFTETLSFPRSIDQLCYTRTIDSYNRFLFVKPKPRIQLDLFLNWKRFIDGFVLSYQPTKNLLRSLK